jgi:hypothetical protein
MDAVGDHELLTRHFAKWASSKHQSFDADLLEAALDLRSHHDERGDTFWPAGSVEDLMLERWPTHGPLDLPDPDALAQTLSSYVHFLRATGRMASGSGDPKALAREARRAAPKMAAACADVGRHSPTKVLQTFGREIGITFDGAVDADELQDRLARIQDAWNALPMAERHARMPLTAAAPSLPSQRLTEAWADESGYDDTPLPASDPDLSAAQATASPFVQDCLRLLEWVGDSGRHVTRTGVLRLADARAAYVDLGAADWERGWQRIERSVLHDDVLSEEAERISSESFWWRSAGECLPLERVWFPCQAAGLLETRATVARRDPRQPQGATEWVLAGSTLLLGLVERFAQEVPVIVLMSVLGRGILDGQVSIVEAANDWAEHEANHDAGMAELMPDDADYWHARGRAAFERCLYLFDDTGIWVRDDDLLRLTDFGRDFARVFFGALDSGELSV